MTDKIIIFNTESVDDSTDSKDDKELFYEEWGGDKYTADTFYQMIKYENDNTFTNSTINTVLIRQIIDYITPIIEFIPMEERVEKIVYKAIRPKKSDDKKVSSKKKIVFKVENNTTCLVHKAKKGEYIVVSKGSTIDIIGFKLNKNITKNSQYIYNYITNLDNGIKQQDLIKSGNITLFNYLDNTYFKFGARVDFSQKLFYFDNIKTDITSLLNMIIKLIKVATDYYDKNTSNLYKTIHLIGSAGIFKTPSKPIIEIKPKCQTIINKMNKILEVDLCYNNHNNIVQNLYNTGYYEYFNKLNLGDDAYSKLKSIMSKKEDKMTQANLIYKQANKKYKSITDEDKAKIVALNDAINNDDKIAIKKAISKSPPVCKHLIYKGELLTKDDGKNEVEKNKIIRNSLISNYSDTTVFDGYFCKLCGEELAKIDYTPQIAVETRTEYMQETYNELQVKIYREISYIVTNFVDFGKSHMHSISGIIKNITDVVKGEMHSIEIGLLKIKTLQSSDVEFTLGIYIYIYAFAFISQLIYLNDTISFKKSLFHGGKVVVVEKVTKVPKVTTLAKKVENTASNEKNLQKIINSAIVILSKIKANDIQKSKVISSSSIKDLFLKAYRWVLNINYTTLEYSTIGYWSQNNNVINYFLYAHKRLEGKASSKSSDPLSAVLGRPYKTIEAEISKNVGIYDTIVKPSKWSDDPYYNDSLLAVYDYINEKLYLENVLAKNSALVNYYTKYAYLLELQKQVQKQNKIREVVPFSPMPVIPYKQPKSTAIDFCNCTNSKYLYQKINSGGNTSGIKKEFSTKEINDWLIVKDYKKINEFNAWIVVDITCTCKKGIKTGHIDTFYKFYNLKCPVGDAHEFSLKNNTECSKCHITQEFIDNLNATYYKKYKNIYEATKNKELGDFNRLKSNVINKNKNNIKFPKYVKDLSAIKKLVTLLNISPNIINNLGLYEKQEWTKSKFDSDLSVGITDNEHLKQNTNLYGHYLFIIRTYYFIRGSDQSTTIPEYLVDFLKSFSNANIDKFPMINENFQDMYSYYKKHMSASLNTNFLLHSIASTLLQILEIFEKNSITTGKKLVKILLDKIIDNEKKLTKFDIHKILRFGRKIESDESPDVDMEIIDANPDYEVVDPDYEVFDEDDDADRDIFNINDLDVEMDEDNLYNDIEDRAS